MSGVWRDVVLNRLLASSLVPVRARWRLLRLYGLKIDGCHISPHVWIGSTRLSVGRDTFINYGCMFNTSAPITIGRNCDLGMQVLIATSTHEIGPAGRRAGAAIARPVVIEDGCWVGARVTILPGVTIGSGSVVAAGAVVTEDLTPNGVYAGVPAKRIKDLDQGVATA